MALINISNILNESLRALKTASATGGIGLFSYKRNRKVIITRISHSHFLVREDGYVTSTKELKRDKFEKELRTIIKREFPRSRKVRLYKFNHEDELQTAYQKI